VHQIRSARCPLLGAIALLAGSPLACAQEAPRAAPVTSTTTNSAQDLLRALQEAGVDLSTLATVNEDGTVTVRLPAPPPAEATDDAEPSTVNADPGADAPAPPPAPEDPAAPKWDHKLTIGFGLSDGNTERANLAAIYSFTRETDRSKLTYDAAYLYAEDSGEESENRFSTGFLHDWLFPGSRWLIFADARYDYDEFQSWRHRLAFHAGPGYKLIDEENIKLTLRAGAGAAKEWLSDNEGWRPEALAGADFDWKISERQSLVSTFRIFPDLDDLGEYRTLTTAGWQMNISKADGLSLTLGLLHEYQTIVDSGRENSDLRLFGGLTFDF
jgi:putative salt-induced outer membrane protein YdiY